MARVSVVALSHTEMSGGYFCSTVALRNKGRWEIWRPMSGPGRHLRYDRMLDDPLKYWMPFQPVSFEFLGRPISRLQRPTHPEDMIIDLPSVRSMRWPEEEDYRDRILTELVSTFMFPSIRVMFPSVIERYVPEAPLTHSNGYIRVERLTIYGERAYFRSGGCSYDLKIKDLSLLLRIRAGKVRNGVYENVLIRIGLAAPFDGKENGWNPRRCYLMVNYVGI